MGFHVVKHIIGGFPFRFNDPLRIVQKGEALRGQTHIFAEAFEQTGVQLRLQLTDMYAYRGLGVAQGLGSL